MRDLIFKITGFIEQALALFFGGSMVILTLIQVFTRYFLKNPPPWSEELARTCFIWVVYIGMSMACRQKGHVNVDFLAKKLPERFHAFADIITNLIVLIFLAVMAVSGLSLVINTRTMMMTSVDIPMGVSYTSIALMGVIMTIYYLFFTLDALMLILKKGNNDQSERTTDAE